jgi:hypothetical protein
VGVLGHREARRIRSKLIRNKAHKLIINNLLVLQLSSLPERRVSVKLQVGRFPGQIS